MMFSNVLERVAKICSALGGLLLVAMMLMTCYSLIGRNLFNSALIGDFELTSVGTGAAIALFMPICQLRTENIIVDFFTANLSPTFNFKLDRLGDVFMTILFASLSWRCAVAAVNAKETMVGSMLLEFPDWIVLTSMSIPFAITAFIAAMQALSKFNKNNETQA
jgi:TRAP-type C4-dicarboxylate transport system permease small subunit